MTSQKAAPGAQEMCEDGPTVESVVAFIDGILEKRRIREGAER